MEERVWEGETLKRRLKPRRGGGVALCSIPTWLWRHGPVLGLDFLRESDGFLLDLSQLIGSLRSEELQVGGVKPSYFEILYIQILTNTSGENSKSAHFQLFCFTSVSILKKCWVSLTLRSFLVPTRKSKTLDGSLSFMASSSHCLHTHTHTHTHTQL